jgi:transcriptional regulator with XRE-family HTH domain
MAVYMKPENTKLLMTRANKSQKQLAEETGVKSSHISNVIAGRYAPSPELRQQIMVALEVKDWDSIFEIKD